MPSAPAPATTPRRRWPRAAAQRIGWLAAGGLVALAAAVPTSRPRNTSAAAGSGDDRPGKPAAFSAVEHADPGDGRLLPRAARAATAGPLTLARDGRWLVIRGPGLPGGELRVLYLETYCRAGSTRADWRHTAMAYETSTLAADPDGRRLRLRDVVTDGLVVEHEIVARDDEVEFRLEATNPTAVRSEAHWAQACVQLAAFTGRDPAGPDLDDYLPKCFVFLDGKLERMPTRAWATKARYTPGQVWRPAHVPEADVNPRPLNPRRPSNGLIGCFSADETLLFATAWEPYQELFQGVIRCLHSDLRLGGIGPGETRRVRGKIYLLPADVPALLARYERDFPEHAAAGH